ncbi:hypothetical protein DEU38_12396 [Rhodococcus sp. AG1013]|uniref:hypothetical protein n=1 Tax=Rhodococcus sp. AG1013 TaxID=2183996 RepID=UPI000E2AE60D|nr:hypothetical protein [Rhodococcus sp. AG1013]RDI17260.1 hypothetical protein DEU38_12396 [Rhodococcus sp. AG1013]
MSGSRSLTADCARAAARCSTGFFQDVATAAANADLGSPGAVKRGRNSRWPYVPILELTGGRAQQLRGLAYATRGEAVARAEREIAAARASLARRLLVPRHRALREQFGLPRELPEPPDEPDPPDEA